MSFATDIRTAGTAAVDQLADVVSRPDLRRPLLAWIGATDYALSRLAGLPERARSAGAVRGEVEDLGKQLVTAYGEFADRGDRTVSRLRREPAVRRMEAGAEQLLDRVDEAVVAATGTASEQVRRADQVTGAVAGEAAEDVAAGLEGSERQASRTVRNRARRAVDRETPPVRRTRSGATTRTTTGTASRRSTSTSTSTGAGTAGARKPASASASRTRARSR